MIQKLHFQVYTQKKLKAGSQRDICAPMFIAALFTIAKTWQKTKCPLTAGRIKKNVVYTYNRVLFLEKERNSDTSYTMDAP